MLERLPTFDRYQTASWKKDVDVENRLAFVNPSLEEREAYATKHHVITNIERLKNYPNSDWSFTLEAVRLAFFLLHMSPTVRKISLSNNKEFPRSYQGNGVLTQTSRLDIHPVYWIW